MLRFLLNAQAITILIKLSHAVTLRVIHPIAEHRSLTLVLSRSDSLPQHRRKARTMENIIAQHKTRRVITDKLTTNDKRLRKTIRRRLLRIRELHAIVRSVTQQTLKPRQISRRRDDKDIPYPRQHQSRDRIIDHRLVKHWEHLLRHPLRNRIQPSAGPTGKNDTFHKKYGLSPTNLRKNAQTARKSAGKKLI